MECFGWFGILGPAWHHPYFENGSMPKMCCVQCVLLFEWVARNLLGNVMPELFSNRKIRGMMFDNILEFESLKYSNIHILY